MSYTPPIPVTGMDLFEYFNEHVSTGNIRTAGFFTLVRPMHVFKKIQYGHHYSAAIANLIIPAGAKVYCPENLFSQFSYSYNRKMRASEAHVHSIVTHYHLKTIQEGFSMYDNRFKYKTGENVVPASFSNRIHTCVSGIHFFMNVSDAFYY